jgi:hypothetical protein
MASRMVMPSASTWSSHSVEVANQRAGAQKRGLVALAFFFGKGDDFKIEGQAFAGLVPVRCTQAMGT